MQLKRSITSLLTILFLFISATVLAQMSDQQVIQEVQKYRNSGMSQEQILQNLSRRGVTREQFQRLRQQFENQGGEEIDNSVESNYDPAVAAGRTSSEIPYNLPVANVDTISAQNRIFGQDFFSRGNLTFAPNMNMPTPANYVLGPGDEVIIDVWGNSELNVRYTIAPDGHITVPGLGRIQLSGLSVQQAEAKIRNEFSSIYSDLDGYNQGTFLAISVGNVRTIKVNVMGEVVTPGTYTLSSFASAFNALYHAGGPSKIGSLRNIHIFRSGKVVATVDLYEYLMHGNNMGDISLRDGDIVQVAPYGILAQITGEVKRPMRYEMREHETLSDLINFSGGFSGDAYTANVSLSRKGVEEMEAYTLSDAEYAHFNLRDGDHVSVESILERFSNRVSISGAVYRPGQYAIGSQVKTVRDLVMIAQGITGDAYTQRVLLYRENEDRTQTMQSFDLAALLDNRIPDIPLQRNDRVHVPSELSLEDNLTVFIGGEVRNPGTYPFAQNMRIEDIILQAGGLTEAASTARVDVYRRIKNPAAADMLRQAGEAFSFSLVDGQIVSSDPSFVLEPFDQIFLRRSPAYEVQQNVTVTGEVLFGGQYAKLTKDERLSSFVKRAGGLTDYAYAKGAKLQRRLTPEEQQRSRAALMTRAREQSDSTFVEELDLSVQYVGIDLEKAMKRPGGSDDLILRDGDVLSIPEFTNTVKISGGVLYPNTVTYNKRMGLDSYVRQAGGYSRLAMKSRPFVIYMNGKVATGRRAKIEPGCEIVVPERPERQPVGIQNILGMSTSLASLALIISRFF